MAKMSIEEFNQKWSEKLKDSEDLAIELMEDATDSFKRDDEELNEEMKKLQEEKDAEIERISGELADLKAKYKERFLTTASAEVVEDVKEDSPVEMQEEEVIDIKEI